MKWQIVAMMLVAVVMSAELKKKKKAKTQSQLLSKMESHKVSAKQKKAMQKASLSAEKSKTQHMKKVTVEGKQVGMVSAQVIIPQNATCADYHGQPYLCTNVPQCGWCAYNQQCLSGDFYGAVNNLCKWYYFVYDRTIWTRFPRYSPWTRTIVPAYYTYYDYGSPFRYSSYYYRPYHAYVGYRSPYYSGVYSYNRVLPVRRVFYK